METEQFNSENSGIAEKRIVDHSHYEGNVKKKRTFSAKEFRKKLNQENKQIGTFSLCNTHTKHMF